MTRPIGHRGIVARLESLGTAVRDREHEGVHHAYVFSGPSGVGKWTTAVWWAMSLKCEEATTCDDDCGSCRQITAGTHPDVAFCRPEDSGKPIKIDQIRELIRLMSLRSQRPGPRLALIDAPDGFVVDAQSAMLKFLEEPPGASIIVIVIDNPALLLPTVRSRCQIIRFGTLTKEELISLLTDAGRSAETAGQASAIARGRASKALAYDPEGLELRATLINEFEAVRGNRQADIEPLVTKLADKKNPRDEWLEMLLEWQVAKIEASAGAEVAEANPDLRNLLDGLDPAHTERLISEASKMSFTRSALARQANAKLAIRELLLDIRG